MLSLIVALAPPGTTDDALNFALSRTAASGLERDGADGADTVIEHGSALLALLPRADELVLVVPSRRLSWHQVTLPKVSHARLRNVLDGLLEDRLLEDPQALHLALAPDASVNGMVWVAACHKAWLYPAILAFESAGRVVARVVPEHVPALAGAATSVYALGSPEAAWLVRCADDGVQAVPFGHAALTALGFGEATWLATAEPAVAAITEELIGGEVKVVPLAQGLVIAARSQWNLAQFQLTSTSGARTARRAAQAWAQWTGSTAWRAARWGFGTLLMTQLIGLNVWAWKERTALDAKRTETRALLTQTFPRVALVVDAPLQMEREVSLLRQATGALSRRDLESMLNAVASNVRLARPPTAIDFVTDELTLKDLGVPASAAAALAQGLARAGYSSQAAGDGWVIKPADAGAPPARQTGFPKP